VTMPDAPGRIVEVLWMDSTGHDGWTDPLDVEELPKRLEARAAGYVIEEADAYLTIALAVGGFNQILTPMCIPRGVIIEVRDFVPGGQARVPDNG
jgi:hypothetical protein